MTIAPLVAAASQLTLVVNSCRTHDTQLCVAAVLFTTGGRTVAGQEQKGAGQKEHRREADYTKCYSPLQLECSTTPSSAVAPDDASMSTKD